VYGPPRRTAREEVRSQRRQHSKQVRRAVQPTAPPPLLPPPLPPPPLPPSRAVAAAAGPNLSGWSCTALRAAASGAALTVSVAQFGSTRSINAGAAAAIAMHAWVRQWADMSQAW
jgi:hypothetical protein